MTGENAFCPERAFSVITSDFIRWRESFLPFLSADGGGGHYRG